MVCGESSVPIAAAAKCFFKTKFSFFKLCLSHGSTRCLTERNTTTCSSSDNKNSKTATMGPHGSLMSRYRRGRKTTTDKITLMRKQKAKGVDLLKFESSALPAAESRQRFVFHVSQKLKSRKSKLNTSQLNNNQLPKLKRTRLYR